ncbi:zinc finger protein 366-like [Contarinia nasturtii]|uniref:zinc finger protein 366-like n=1 Tax=Contarinia nasturtii TaxID=265458 RepID=UPI0012D49FE9|nr:zinc finger protein 366-like [Contarinia nasturtii]
MEIMKFCYLCFDRTKDVYPVVDETFMQKFINFSPGNITIGRTTLCKECSRRIQYFDDLKEFGARSSALRNNLAYNIVPEKIQMHHNGKPSNRKKYIRRKIPCKCMLCQKEFQSKCYLHKHMKRHQNVKSAYKCMICNGEFLSANSLSAHEKTHPTYK